MPERLDAHHRRFLLGSYTPDGPAPSVHLAERSADGDWRIVTSATASNPSFVARSGDLAFAVFEDASGSVASFRLDGDAITPIDVVEHGEADPCHVVAAMHLGVVLVANYTSGSITAVPVDDAGALGAPVTLPLPAGGGPVPDRQAGPHAHEVVATPWGTHVVSNLGGDAIHEFAVDRGDGGRPVLRITRTLDVPAGSGPRHMVVRGGLLHVVGELDGDLHTFEVDATSFRPASSTPTVGRTATRADDVVQPSHLDHAPSGRLLTALVRGRDTVSVFDATDAARPRLASEHAVGAAWPRHHAHLDDRTVAVAAQLGDALVEVDLVTGATRRVLELTAPSCVVPID
ncbi:lactonase family protein [Agromyces kandeliae]|uniref:Beta-propeller fold lactonase family protein n=1 Tax=Agromyces kandeliae TaxID=2666141 RepID=A0A6L5R215_9MICO|nr:beta-propeller fold lactonase family protein [Agromyces kandeliae]MRX44071.1 beta-propeller fold lactonase family protein [Agromyces kandeliae]